MFTKREGLWADIEVFRSFVISTSCALFTIVQHHVNSAPNSGLIFSILTTI